MTAHLDAFARLSVLCADPVKLRWVAEQTQTGFIVYLVRDKHIEAQSDDLFYLPDAIQEACDRYAAKFQPTA